MRRKKILAIVAIIISLCHYVHASSGDSLTLAQMDQTWQEFRAIHPYGFQTVGLKRLEDNRYFFVMSEPNGWVTEESLRQLFTKYGGQVELKYHPYGIDGELTDAVGYAKLDSVSFTRFKKELFTLLYRTDYKPVFTDLNTPAERVIFSDIPLDYSFSAKKFQYAKYAVLDGFHDLPKSIDRLCDTYFGSNDVFYAFCPNSVVWLLDKNIDVENDSTFLPNARRFALDTDLIMGTYQTKDKIAIIGRERVVPIEVLPPMRSETILFLATTDEPPTLFFDRSSTVALNDSIYATPIRTSKTLRDTELGNLMYLTDAMLKSWSENGKVTDILVDIPQPKAYPFPDGVAHELGLSTRYLWNFMSADTLKSGLCPSIRTGCLPPVYWSGNDSLIMKQNIMSVEAHEFFARQNSPDLVRVAMYATLYRVFRTLAHHPSFAKSHSWVQTPSFTTSNVAWGEGGYLYQGLVKGSVKGLKSGGKVKPIPINTPGSTPIRRQPPIGAGSNTSGTNLSNVQRAMDAMTNSVKNPTLTIPNAYAAQYESQSKSVRPDHFLDTQRGLRTNESESQSMSARLDHSWETQRGLRTNESMQNGSRLHILTDEAIGQDIVNAAQRQQLIMEMRQQMKERGIPLRAIKSESQGIIFGRIYYIDDKQYDYAA